MWKSLETPLKSIKLLTFFKIQSRMILSICDVLVLNGLIVFKYVFFSRKPRGVRSKRIRQKERLVRYETPPSAAGGGTPRENMREKRRQKAEA